MATDKRTSTYSPSTPDPLLFLAGRNLAVVVLGEMLEAGPDRCSIEDTQRHGLGQCNALARAIDWLREAPAEVIQGFAAVFTDRACSGVDTKPDQFERMTIEQMGVMRACSNVRH